MSIVLNVCVVAMTVIFPLLQSEHSQNLLFTTGSRDTSAPALLLMPPNDNGGATCTSPGITTDIYHPFTQSKIYTVSDQHRTLYAYDYQTKTFVNQSGDYNQDGYRANQSDDFNTSENLNFNQSHYLKTKGSNYSGIFNLELDNPLVTASELELNNFDTTADLKNYATVNVLEPQQISYNIGTESVDADEPLKNTELNLEESSVITEIENPNFSKNIENQKVDFNIELLTNDENFNNLFATFKNQKDELIDLNKQIQASEAIEMSLVCEEEVPSQWVDVMALATSQNSTDLYEPLNENPLSAIPTAIQSYIDIKSPKNYELFNNYNFENEKEIEGVINDTIKEINAKEFLEEKTTNTNENLLKNLTAEANICSCIDCKCGPENSCNQDDSCYVKDKSMKIDKGCCNKTVSCNCSGKNDTQCCVMVCLKSLDQLRHVLSLANKCCSLQSLTMGFNTECCKK